MGNKPTTMRRIMPLVAAVLVTGAGASARLSFAQEQQPPPPPPTQQPPVQPPAPQPEQQPDLLKAASDDPKLSRLVTAIKAAGLEETLKTGGPYTIFAPTTSAFAKMPEGAYDDLLKPENKEKLAGILKYHIVAQKLTEADLKEGAELKTLNGGTVKVKLQPSLTVNDAKVTKTDIQASNGVIYHIDTVLTPAPAPA
ncbi:MAG TPA: fasciclin domain-containing protein, partial [Armatimonadaceae bacterium]|nr:fasciclin domain-containing protein [Armatimonadaceae bacterium]